MNYRIVEISLDKDGVFWVTYYGAIPEQGGMRWGKGQVGFETILGATDFIQYTVEENLKTYKELISKKP